MDIRSIRNRVNSAIDKAKTECVHHLLSSNHKDPKRLWRNIKAVIDNDDRNSNNFSFKDPDSGVDISKTGAYNFVNEYFATIADRICKPEDSVPFIAGDRIGTYFAFCLLDDIKL